MKYAVLLLIVMFSGVSYAVPTLFDAYPKDGGYTGRGIVNFSVNITSPDLITSTVTLFVISEDAYQHSEPWDSYSMSCSGDPNWNCSRGVSFSIAGTDTVEFFYFTANDSSGEGSLGSPSSPIVFTVDRTAPQIVVDSPLNGSYVSGSVTPEVTVTDAVSGFNESTLEQSVNGGVWSSIQPIDTTVYSDNETVIISIRAVDNASNLGEQNTSVIVDNEGPHITVTKPTDSEIISGLYILNITVTDPYSGFVSATYTLGETEEMDCTDGVCTFTIDTSTLNDGNHTITFTAYDNATNANLTNIDVIVKNNQPSMIVSPEGYAKGTVNITASIYNSEGTISAVTLNISDHLVVSMNCNAGFTLCSYLWDASEGSYLLTVVADSSLYNVSDTANLIIDNTNPAITITADTYVNTTEKIEATIVDTNHDRNNVIVSVLGNAQTMTCVPQGITLMCSFNYDFSTFNQGKYNLTVTAGDHAKNSFTVSKEVAKDTTPPTFGTLTVDPPNPSTIGDITLITAGVNDAVSGVASVRAILLHSGSKLYHDLVKNNGAWTKTITIEDLGQFDVSIYAQDFAGNSVEFDNVGYFFVGQLSCGDFICQYGENYCLCPMDCDPITCEDGSKPQCGSGIPLCLDGTNCGNGVCDIGETCNSCSSDCGVCTGDNAPVSDTISGNQGAILGDAGEVFQVVISNPYILGVAVPAIIILIIIIILEKRKHRKVEKRLKHLTLKSK